jgi:hypothetical protein
MKRKGEDQERKIYTEKRNYIYEREFETEDGDVQKSIKYNLLIMREVRQRKNQ